MDTSFQNTLTALAAALAFALVACQPDTARLAGAKAADAEPSVVVATADEDEDDEQDAEREQQTAASDTPAKQAEATEQAQASASDALLDTRGAGNPLADPVIMPVEPIAEADEDDDDDR